MQPQILVLVFAALLPFSNAWFFDWFKPKPDPFWNGLRTTFAADGAISWVPFYDSTGYAPVPRTEPEAIKSNWVKIDESQECENGGMFNGFRYIYKINATDNDWTVAAMYDKNGVISGIQMNIDVAEQKANTANTYKFDEIKMFLKNTVNGREVYTLTAYFVNPTTICSTGRDISTAITNKGTGSDLNFQNGASPDLLINAPHDRAQALAEKWSDNKCFVGMGVHNWYEQEHFQDDNCDTIRPVFLLYTKQDNKLLGFGFQHVGKSIAPRFEQPPSSVVKLIVGENASPCLIEKADGVGVTTMHVFLINNPLSQTCLPTLG